MKLISLLISTILLSTTVQSSEISCRKIFREKSAFRIEQTSSKEKGYVLTPEDLQFIQTQMPNLRFFNWDRLQDKSPEFLVYFILSSRADSRSHLYYIDFDSFSRVRLEEWIRKKITQANITWEGVPNSLRKEWLATVYNELNYYKIANERGRSIADPRLIISYLKILKNSRLEKEELKNWIRTLASLYARSLSYNGRLHEVYSPKLYQFAKQIIRKDLELDYLPLTDLVGIKDGNSVYFNILSLTPPYGAKSAEIAHGLFATEIGFHKIQGTGRAGQSLVNNQTKWRIGDRDYSANYSIKLGPEVSKIAPTIDSLDFESMWRDKKLTGLVLPGANMRDFTSDVLVEYREYYEENGFRFSPKKTVSDFKTFLKEEITSGRLDYFLKEAHGSGSDRELVKLINDGSILTGRKHLSGGREEIIHLYYPNSKKQKNSIGEELTFDDFSFWMKERVRKKDAPQMLYLDTSCHGLGQICYVVSKSITPKLVAIGSDSTADTFTNQKETALLYILNGIRRGKSFPQIREDLEKNSQSYREEGENEYRFPDETAWKDAVHGQMTRALDIDIKVYDQEGRPFTIESLEEELQR